MYHHTKPVKKSLQSNFAALEFDRFTKQVDCFFITTEHLACFIKNDGNQNNPRIVGVASD